MNDPDYFDHRHDDRLGVNKIGRNIRKSPPIQPYLPTQPHVYNIHKDDFRSIVQQLTGSPSHHSQQPPAPSNRFQRTSLAPINVNRPQMPTQMPQPRAPPQTAESPISAYMRYLQHSITDPTPQTPRLAGLPPTRMTLPSPSGYMNLLSPLSPYPLFSPGYQHLSPIFSFSPMAQSGIFGPRPPSPGIGFPSPGFFNLSSPRWRN